MKVEVLLIAVGIAAASISFMVLKPADILQPFRNAVYKIEVIRDRNADVAKQLGVEIHDVRPTGVTANTVISASITGAQNAASEETPVPESSAASLSPPLSAAAATEAAAAAANANAATVKAFSELH